MRPQFPAVALLKRRRSRSLEKGLLDIRGHRIFGPVATTFQFLGLENPRLHRSGRMQLPAGCRGVVGSSLLLYGEVLEVLTKVDTLLP